MLEPIYNKWSKVVTGEVDIDKPDMCNFNNITEALEMLHKHFFSDSRIVVHCDVDMDGFGCGAIIKKFFENCCTNKPKFVTNRVKEHGICERHVEWFNNNDVDFVLIVDSSSNNIEYIKQINCDVLVIDHHEITHSEYSGVTNDGKHNFLIVNNMIDNLDCEKTNMWLQSKYDKGFATVSKYLFDSRMSCGLVVYELLRVFQYAYKLGTLLENLMLYQWVGVTLFTDVINLLCDRNQWYIRNTVNSNYMEPSLKSLCSSLSSYNTRLTKTVINYSLAPAVNRAIRAGQCGEALRIVLDAPMSISELNKYRELQDEAVEKAAKLAEVHDGFALVNITDSGISPSYAGVIAAKIADTYSANTVTYCVDENGMASGSFRGRSEKTDYRGVFDTYSESSSGQGHRSAFGFKARVEEIIPIMESLGSVELEYSSKPYLTCGDIDEKDKGVYHIDDIEQFKRAGGILLLSVGNSRMDSDNTIRIRVPRREAMLCGSHGKLLNYSVYGLNCKAFSEPSSEWIELYPEFNTGVEVFIR